jgi:4-carboxymuconolactone decarboxylase
MLPILALAMTAQMPEQPASRVAVPPVGTMDDRQKAIRDQSSQFLGGPYGPRMALINLPEIEAGWGAVLTALEKTRLDRRLWELSILIVARRWDSQFEWWAHAPRAAKTGLSPTVISDLRDGRMPHFDRPDEAAVYRYFTELYQRHDVSDDAYAHLIDLIGSDATVELSVLAAHYDGVAMLIASQHVVLPPGAQPPLPQRKPSGASR